MTTFFSIVKQNSAFILDTAHMFVGSRLLHLMPTRPSSFRCPRPISPIPPLQRREIKRLAPPRLPRRPGHRPGPGTPPERAHPRLDVPAHHERRVAPLGHLPRDVRDLVLGLLVPEAEDAWAVVFVILVVPGG